MTRAEAIKQIESLFEHCEAMMTSDEPVWSQDCEALQIALSAPSPGSRWRRCGESGSLRMQATETAGKSAPCVTSLYLDGGDEIGFAPTVVAP